MPRGKDRCPAHHGSGEAQTTSVSIPPKLGKEKDGEAHRIRESKRQWERGGRKKKREGRKKGMVVTPDVTQCYLSHRAGPRSGEKKEPQVPGP